MAISISSRERCRSSTTFLIVFGGLIFLSSLSLAGCEIHRTRTSRVARATAKAYPGSEGTLTVLGDDEQPVSDGGREELETDDFTNNAYSQTEAWIYALGATVLVGLSGIFPLFLPIEIDPSAHDERGKFMFFVNMSCMYIVYDSLIWGDVRTLYEHKHFSFAFGYHVIKKH